MKTLFWSLFFILTPMICIGEETHWVNENGETVSGEDVADFIFDNTIKMFEEQAREMQPVYEKLKTCLPIQNQYFHIIGIENDLCHFKYVDYDCFVPLNIAEEYAELGLKSGTEMINGHVNTESRENIRIKEILSNKDYCSYNMTWSVTMEDENGNEVPVDGVTFK